MAILGDFISFAGEPKEDEDIYNKCREQKWCRDLISQYKDYNSYNNYGLGVAILKNGELVSGASSYSRYESEIEIEIDTNEKSIP